MAYWAWSSNIQDFSFRPAFGALLIPRGTAQDIREDAFMEINDKTYFPGFRRTPDFGVGSPALRRVESGAWQRHKKALGETCASEDQDLGTCDMLTRIQEPERKSWLNGKGLHNET